MSIEIWLAFVVASSVLLIIPGPTILTVISYSITHGYRARIPLIIAVALGDSTALALSLLGLGALLAESAFWFQVVKWAGGLYLLFLGVKMLRSGIRPPQLDQSAGPGAGGRLFLNTYLVTALNPKGIMFFVAFLPQFINVNAEVVSQLWLLALTFVVLAAVNATLYTLFAGKARRILSSPTSHRIFNLSGGSLLSAAGVWALSARQS